MKKLLSLLLAFLVVFPLTIPALATADSDAPPEWLVPGWTPPEEEVTEATSTPVSELETVPESALLPESEPAPATSIESADSNADETDNSADIPASNDNPEDAAFDEEYPTGSYIDTDGQVFSPSGALLSPVAAETAPQAEVSDYTVHVLVDTEDDKPLAVDIVTSGAAYVLDMRPTDDSLMDDSPPAVLSGLKVLVTSIFGEYTPVMTNTVVSQTIDGDTYQYLIETVAPGCAGVDYEWIAGVVLFAILLYCLMKLLGGVLT